MITRSMPTVSRIGFSTGISCMVEQFGFATMPRWPRAASGLTSATTSGTSGSIRNADELSTTTAPRSTAIGAHSRERAAPALNSAMSTPSNSSGATACTSISSSPKRTRLPALRGDARQTRSSTGNSRSPSTVRSTSPTAPVAPRMATLGTDGLLLHRLAVQLERLVQRAHRGRHLGLRDHAGDLDRRGRDHPQVDALVGERAEHLGGDARVGAHAGADQRHLRELVVLVDLHGAEHAHRVVDAAAGGVDVLRRHGE